MHCVPSNFLWWTNLQRPKYLGKMWFLKKLLITFMCVSRSLHYTCAKFWHIKEGKSHGAGQDKKDLTENHWKKQCLFFPLWRFPCPLCAPLGMSFCMGIVPVPQVPLPMSPRQVLSHKSCPTSNYSAENKNSVPTEHLEWPLEGFWVSKVSMLDFVGTPCPAMKLCKTQLH